VLREKIHSPADLFAFKLGAALTMEKVVHDTLLEMRARARHPELRRLFGDHADETDVQIANLARAFALLDAEPAEKSCPVVKALRADGRLNLKRVESPLADDIIAGAAGETEHYEIAVYEELIIVAESIGRGELADLLQQNPAQEQRALANLRRIMRAIADDTLGSAA
jgi:ferritin-like metal-binding protein YciE